MERQPLKLLNFATLLQQQRYIVAISFLFYISNGLTFSDFLLFQSIFYFTGLLAEIPAGYIGDIFPRKNVLIFSYMLFMVRILMWIFVPNYFTILLGEILYGLSKAFYRGVSDGYIYDYLKINNNTKLMLNRYGKFNFFMSMGTAISCLFGAFLYKYVGFSILLCFELFFNSTAIFILFFLPQIPQTKKNIAFYKHLFRIFRIIKNTVKNSKINIYILYGGILSGVTSIFVWNFQPLMKSCAVPTFLFGVVYFINHILRAFSSAGADKFLSKFSLIRTGWLVWIGYLLSFILLIYANCIKKSDICIEMLILVCLAIGIQMIFNIGNLSRVHSLIPSVSRATISSISSMLASLFSGVFLMIFKLLSENNSIKLSLGVFMILFFSVIIILRLLTVRAKNYELQNIEG